MAIEVGAIASIKAEYRDVFGFLSALDGTGYTGAGIVTDVEPSREDLAKYPEINPYANTKNRFVYYDKGAERHFIVGFECAEA